MKTDKQKLDNLGIHESIELTDNETLVTRVPGGFLYRFWTGGKYSPTATFVPDPETVYRVHKKDHGLF